MLDYDKEAGEYDATRGGEPRAAAAAQSVLGLVPEEARSLLDIACGTGLVTRLLAAGRPGLRVAGADTSYGMARMAAKRLPGTVVLADSRRLPFQDGSFDAVSVIWLLHLLDDAASVVAEAARVLRPGGVLVTTVDKDAAHHVGSDIDALAAPYLKWSATDGATVVTARAAEHGLLPGGTARFRGHGQGRIPRRLARHIRDGKAYAAGGAALAERIESLPDPERPRPDPEFTLLAFRKPKPSA
ncbi:class I SAM-dependent methyltransferase [Streptomyces sp. NBC_00038]|uniref:class I SAM-dependent methyltransferase n=1 Tax=Streptomyces sp. NBC_00038 TaxID=2903615 RepID=UPI002251B353|nr:class I SAM-dependent methyltransferase [Streptomyces sp. NBC_00038]MCX5561965.1 class I SAM-dependent methyltransferase [Streptomyces sp. NBC_00038]